MKSSQINRNFFSSNQLTTTLCVKGLSLFSFSRASLWARGLFIHVRRHRLSQAFARVVKGQVAGLTALLLAAAAVINRRIFVGLFLMGVVAPLSACFYMLFDWRVDKVPGWYHDNYFHFFLLLGPSFFILFCLLGTFLLFPQGSKRAYILAIPSGFTVGKILWLALLTSNQEFYRVVPQSFIAHGISISLVLFMTLDWFTWRKFHREDAFEARLDLLAANADEFEPKKVVSMLKSIHREKKEFPKQY